MNHKNENVYGILARIRDEFENKVRPNKIGIIISLVYDKGDKFANLSVTLKSYLNVHNL